MVMGSVLFGQAIRDKQASPDIHKGYSPGDAFPEDMGDITTPAHAAARAAVQRNSGRQWRLHVDDDDERQEAEAEARTEGEQLSGADRLPAAEGTYESVPDYTKGKRGRKRQLRELQYVVAHHLDHDHAEDAPKMEARDDPGTHLPPEEHHPMMSPSHQAPPREGHLGRSLSRADFDRVSCSLPG